MEPYNESIDYKKLLSRYVHYVFENWIIASNNQKKYPHLLHKTPKFEFKFSSYTGEHGTRGNKLFIIGEIYGPSVHITEPENENVSFYRLLNNAMKYGFIVETGPQGVAPAGVQISYVGTVDHLMEVLDFHE